MTRRPKQPAPCPRARLDPGLRPDSEARARRSAGRGARPRLDREPEVAAGGCVVAVLLLDLATLERGGLAARDEVARARLRALPLGERWAEDLVEALRGAAVGGVASPAQALVLRRRGISLDRLRRVVEVNGAPVDLTRREYDLLQVFMQDPGRPLHRNRLVAEAWGGEGDGNLLDVHMSRLRAKIAVPLGRPAFKTVRGVGYQLL